MLNEGGLGSQIDKMVNLNRDNPEELKKKAKVQSYKIRLNKLQGLWINGKIMPDRNNKVWG